MRRARALAVLVLAVAAGSGCQPVGAGDADGTVGTVVRGAPGDTLRGTSGFLLLPTGRLAVTVGATVDDVPSDRAADGVVHHAPGRGAFVPVQTRFDPAADPAFVLGLTGGQPHDVALTLLAGGRRYPLPAPYHAAGPGISAADGDPRYVAVADADAGDLTVEATYDGVSQRLTIASGLRDEGRAAGLYAVSPSQRTVVCRRWRGPGVARAVVDGAVGAALHTPYDGALGWAPEGREWSVVPLDVGFRGLVLRRRGHEVAYDAASALVRVRLDGRGPADTAADDPTSVTGLSQRLVFDSEASAPGVLRVTATLDLRRATTATTGPPTALVTVGCDLRP